MKKLMLLFMAVLFLTGMLSACTNQDLGTAGGAVVGGVAGSSLTHGSTGGTIAGAVGGGYIGRQLSQ